MSRAWNAPLAKLEVMEKRLRQARHVVHCVEVAATAEDAELELGPVAFVAVELIDRVLDDLTAIMSLAGAKDSN